MISATTQLMIDSIVESTSANEQEIISFVDAHNIKYSDVRDFAVYLERMPTEEEAAYIGLHGIDAMLTVHNIDFKER